MAKAKAKAAKDVIDVDRLVRMLDLPAWDDVNETNVDYIGGARVAVYDEAIKEGLSEEEAEDRSLKAEQEAGDEVYRNWHGAVTSAADELFGHHHLELVPVRKAERTPFEYTVEPVAGKTWADAARELATTINGVGMVSVSAEEYARSPRRFVLEHLGSIAYYPDVYGTASASRIYERSW